MSLPDRILRLGTALGAALTLAACIQPLYGSRVGQPGGSPVATTLTGIDVEPATNRIDQQIRNNVIFALTGGSAAPAPTYRLTITTTENVQSAVVDPFTSRPTTETYALNASWSLTLVDPVPNARAVTGTAFGRASYDRSRQRFASLRARRDAEDRAAKVVAEQIVTQIAGRIATGQ